MTFLEIQDTEQPPEMPLGLYWRGWIFESPGMFFMKKECAPEWLQLPGNW